MICKRHTPPLFKLRSSTETHSSQCACEARESRQVRNAEFALETARFHARALEVCESPVRGPLTGLPGTEPLRDWEVFFWTPRPAPSPRTSLSGTTGRVTAQAAANGSLAAKGRRILHNTPQEGEAAGAAVDGHLSEESIVRVVQVRGRSHIGCSSPRSRWSERSGNDHLRSQGRTFSSSTPDGRLR